MEREACATSQEGGGVVNTRCWFGFFAAIARRRESEANMLACDLGMPTFAGRYGFGAEVGRA